PRLWNLLAITNMLILPWLRLRRWTFTTEKLSDHALRLHFINPVHRFSCLSISTSPLRDWHPFTTFPHPKDSYGNNGTSIIARVLSLSLLFSRVIFVTPGLGIGPCLSSLLSHPHAQLVRLVWSTPRPIQTFGEHINELVDQVDPDAIVIDTREMGRPDLVRLACRMYKECQAEAVFVLSNEKVTRMVVGGLERRGVRAFGPIWDS
ncbi:hypothetical protein K469DRAFT_573965, partial [Zopfia rhizophila CBS 207.26]